MENLNRNITLILPNNEEIFLRWEGYPMLLDTNQSQEAQSVYIKEYGLAKLKVESSWIIQLLWEF